jgi:UDP-N-acetylglucosamine 2-epimerase (non-hydrolysing)
MEEPVKVHLITAARPNHMKVAPLFHTLREEDWCNPVLVHTGQHYDVEMSDVFLRDLGLPEPAFSLEVAGGRHGESTGRAMIEYEKLCLQNRPDWIVAVGDVNSTAACTLVGVKLGILTAHLEAGLRSGDRSMPEEINRIVTDAIADVLWTPSADADANLCNEGIPQDRITRVGNIMLDSYEMLRGVIEQRDAPGQFKLTPGSYAVLTLHRPSNVDAKQSLDAIVAQVTGVAQRLPILFPVHPRTRARLIDFDLMPQLEQTGNVIITGPLGYVDLMSLVRQAKLVITDSGGLQEETTYLNVPCLTLRANTERPITIEQGTNQLVTPASLSANVDAILAGHWRSGKRPELWDGQTAQRVAADLRKRAGV